MGRHYQILMPLLSLFWSRVELTDLVSLSYEAHILNVTDGDSLEISIGNSVYKTRLLYIDSPEKGQASWNKSMDAGEFSKQCLMKLLKEKERVQIFGFDMYGRALITIGQINYQMVSLGCSSLYPYSTFTSRFEKGEYIRAYFKARSERIGLWKYGGFKNPMSYRKDLKRKSKTSSRRNHFVSK